MYRMRTKKMLTLVFCAIFCLNIVIYARAENNGTLDNSRVCYEVSALSAPLPEAVRNLSVNDNSWAVLDVDANLTTASIYLKINNHIYNFDVFGSAEAVGPGHVGFYQGYLEPDEDDLLMQSLLRPDSSGILVSVNAVICGEDTFFTLVIGIIANNQNPIVKAYGTRTNVIDNIIKAHAKNKEDFYKANLYDYDEAESSNVTQASVDALTRYQSRKSIYDSSYRVVGEVSLFHANELRNQGSMSVYAKVNSNTKNANAYARNYFGLTSNDISVVYPTKVELSVSSNDKYLHIDGINYAPTDETKRITVSVPFYLNGSFDVVDTNMTISSVDATTSGSAPYYNQNVKWITRHSLGLVGLDGSYSSKHGLPGFASYKYEGTVRAPKNATLTASAYIMYTVYVEDATYGTLSEYTFTTETKSCTSNVSVIP